MVGISSKKSESDKAVIYQVFMTNPMASELIVLDCRPLVSGSVDF